jgi:hypothetical protein
MLFAGSSNLFGGPVAVEVIYGNVAAVRGKRCGEEGAEAAELSVNMNQLG